MAKQTKRGRKPKGFDKVSYQREYMRQRRAAQRAAAAAQATALRRGPIPRARVSSTKVSNIITDFLDTLGVAQKAENGEVLNVVERVHHYGMMMTKTKRFREASAHHARHGG
jgi:hypothetical protein